MDDKSRQSVAEVYARPVFELSLEEGLLEQVNDELASLAKVFKVQHGFIEILQSPFMLLKDRTKMARKIFADRTSKITAGLIEVLIKRNRIGYIADIAELFEVYKLESQGVNLISVTLAKKPSDSELSALNEKFTKTVAGQVRLSVKVDPSIIGGIIIEHGDITINNSIRRSLEDAAMKISKGVGVS